MKKIIIVFVSLFAAASTLTACAAPAAATTEKTVYEPHSGSAEEGNTLNDCAGSCALWYTHPEQYKARFVIKDGKIVHNPDADKK